MLNLLLSQSHWRHITRHEIRAAEPAKTVRRLVGLILRLIAVFVGVSVAKLQFSAEKLSSSKYVQSVTNRSQMLVCNEPKSLDFPILLLWYSDTLDRA